MGLESVGLCTLLPGREALDDEIRGGSRKEVPLKI